MYEPIRTKSVHTMAGTTSDFPHRSREEELDIQLAGHLAALLAVTDELRAIAPSGDLDAAAERLTAQVARLRGRAVPPVRSSVADAAPRAAARLPPPAGARPRGPRPRRRGVPRRHGRRDPRRRAHGRPRVRHRPAHHSRPTEPPGSPRTAPVRAHRSDVRTGCHSTAFALAVVSLAPGFGGPRCFRVGPVTWHRRSAVVAEAAAAEDRVPHRCEGPSVCRRSGDDPTAPSAVPSRAAPRSETPGGPARTGHPRAVDPRSGTRRSGCVPGPRRHPVFTPAGGNVGVREHALGCETYRRNRPGGAADRRSGSSRRRRPRRSGQGHGNEDRARSYRIGEGGVLRRSRRGEGPRCQGLHREDGDLRVLGHGGPGPQGVRLRLPFEPGAGRRAGRQVPRTEAAPPALLLAPRRRGAPQRRRGPGQRTASRRSTRPPAPSRCPPTSRRPAQDRTWQQLKGSEKYGELTGTLFIATTDPETSNSGALYLAAASYVADGGRVADGQRRRRPHRTPDAQADQRPGRPTEQYGRDVQGLHQRRRQPARPRLRVPGRLAARRRARTSATSPSSTRTPRRTATTPSYRSLPRAARSVNSSAPTRRCASSPSGTGSGRRARARSSRRRPPPRPGISTRS